MWRHLQAATQCTTCAKFLHMQGQCCAQGGNWLTGVGSGQWRNQTRRLGNSQIKWRKNSVHLFKKYTPKQARNQEVGNQAISPEIFKIVFSCWVHNMLQSFCPPPTKISAGCDLPLSTLRSSVWHCFSYPQWDPKKQYLMRILDLLRSRTILLTMTTQVPR